MYIHFQSLHRSFTYPKLRKIKFVLISKHHFFANAELGNYQNNNLNYRQCKQLFNSMVFVNFPFKLFILKLISRY